MWRQQKIPDLVTYLKQEYYPLLKGTVLWATLEDPRLLRLRTRVIFGVLYVKHGVVLPSVSSGPSFLTRPRRQVQHVSASEQSVSKGGTVGVWTLRQRITWQPLTTAKYRLETCIDKHIHGDTFGDVMYPTSNMLWHRNKAYRDNEKQKTMEESRTHAHILKTSAVISI